MSYYIYPSPLILEASGPDAQRYLNSRLTNDLKNLRVNESLQAACISSQGKTLGVFHVHRCAGDKFILVCRDDQQGKVLSALKQFIVADRIEIRDLSHDFKLAHKINQQDPAYIYKFSCNLIGSPEDAADLVINTDLELAPLMSREQFELLRIKAGNPIFPIEVNERFLLSESGLQHTLVAKNKGCYVGQEVIEKIASHGKLPKKLIPMSFQGKLSEAQLLPNGLEPYQLVSYAYDQTSNLTHAFVRSST